MIEAGLWETEEREKEREEEKEKERVIVEVMPPAGLYRICRRERQYKADKTEINREH